MDLFNILMEKINHLAVRRPLPDWRPEAGASLASTHATVFVTDCNLPAITVPKIMAWGFGFGTIYSSIA